VHALTPAEALDEISGVLEGAIAIGHFVSLDLRVLRHEARTCGRRFECRAVCTARAQSWLQHRQAWVGGPADRLDDLSLATVANHYGVEPGAGLHHALGDAFLTAQVWQKMLNPLHSHGICRLSDLLRIAKA